jgi:NADH:ubiquinone oxidoreductase subunit 3 (subunit A)
MFIAFDVIAMFLFTWGLAFSGMSSSQNYLFLIFIAILVAPLGYASYLAGKREFW